MTENETFINDFPTLWLKLWLIIKGERNINSRCVKQLRYNTRGQEWLYDEAWWIFTPKNVGGPPMVSAHHDESSTKKKVFQFLWQLTQSSRWGFVLAIWVNSGGTFSIMSNRLLLSSYFPFTKVNETYFPITVLLPFFPLEGIVCTMSFEVSTSFTK